MTEQSDLTAAIATALTQRPIDATHLTSLFNAWASIIANTDAAQDTTIAGLSGGGGGLTPAGSDGNIQIKSGTSLAAVSDSGASTSTFLRGDKTWVTPPSGGGSTSPGGSNGQIQINNSGAFGGIANTGASSSTYLRGDMTWATPSGGGGGTVTGLAVANNIAVLRALTGLTNGAAILCLGYWNVGDGGGGIFRMDTSDTTTAEDYAFNLIGGTTGRLKRVVTSPAVDVRWFGAVWNDASHTLSSMGFATLAAARAQYPEAMALTDEIDGVALQRAINWVLFNPNSKWTAAASKFAKILLPAGRGFSSRSIVVGYGAQNTGISIAYSQLIIEGQGSVYSSGQAQFTGTTLYFNNHRDGFGFGCQGNIRTSFREMRIDGLYNYMAGKPFGKNGYLYESYYQDSTWNGGAGGTTPSSLYMYCAVCIDPFTTVGALPSGFTWQTFRLPPELWGSSWDSTPTGNSTANHYFTYGDGTGLYNSDGVNLFNVTLADWYVGHGRIGGDSNSEWNTWEGQNSGSTYVILPMMNTGSQSRQPVANSVKFQNYYCVYSGAGGLNPNIGNIQATFKDCHLGFGIRIINAVNGWAGPFKLDGCYGESIAMIGVAETVTLDNTYLALLEQDITYGVPDFHLIGDLVMQGGAKVVVSCGLFVAGNVTAIGSNVILAARAASDVAQAGSSTTITLGAGTPNGDNFYSGMPIYIQTGTGAGQVRTISGYVASTKVATVSSAWTTAPDATSTYLTGQDVYGFALALGCQARGGIFATGNVELYAHNQNFGTCASRDHSTMMTQAYPAATPGTTATASAPNYWVQPYQTSSAAAAYRRTYEQRFASAHASAVPLAFDSAAVPNITTIAMSVAVNSRSNRDITCTRYAPTTGVKADIGDVFAISASNPDRPTWFICIQASGTTMVLRQMSNYYKNWYDSPSPPGSLYATQTGSATAEIVAGAYANSQYSCSRVYDLSMYGYIGTTGSGSITNLKSRQTGSFPSLPDRTFPVLAGDTSIFTDNSDAWLNPSGSAFSTYALISGLSGTTMSFSGSPSLPTTATVRPRFFIRNFNA
ncbi:MAG: hypothetical protein JO051_03410 [Acidobacteriaceae bacterium]|nr:hypothetical protein [Acidobacteriaceae bacterium]